MSPPSNPIARLLERIVAFAIALFQRVLRGLLGAPRTAARAATEPIQIRRAQAQELLAVRHAVLRAGRPPQTARFGGDALPDTRHWAAERLGMVIGVVSVMPNPLPEDTPWPLPGPTPRLQLRGMAVLPEYRGSGLGGALLEAVHAEVAAPMWCNARTTAVEFYARHGWRPIGAPFEMAATGPHQRMGWVP